MITCNCGGLILWRVGRSYSMEGGTVLFYRGWDGLILSRVGRSYLRVVFAYKWSNITWHYLHMASLVGALSFILHRETAGVCDWPFHWMSKSQHTRTDDREHTNSKHNQLLKSSNVIVYPNSRSVWSDYHFDVLSAIINPIQLTC